MNLYEIGKRADELMELMTAVCIDEETGEIVDNGIDTEAVLAELMALEEDKTRIKQWMAQKYINIGSDISAIESEMERLKKMKDRKTKQKANLLAAIDRACEGQNTDLGVGKLSHRASTSTIVSDSRAAIVWLKMHGYNDAVKQADPSIDKTAVKKLIKGGVTVPGCELQDKTSVSFN